MMNIAVGLAVGVLAGLLLRPILDAYLFWRMADWFRRDSSPERESSDERDVDHRTGV